MRIHKAGLTDWDELKAFIVSCGLPTEGLSEHLATTYIARLEGVVVGASAVETYEYGLGVLRSVAVAKHLRGTGLGRTLVGKSLDLARRRGLCQLLLLTQDAGSFFAKFGFEKIERSTVHPTIAQSTEFLLDRCNRATVMSLNLTNAHGTVP